MEKFDSSSILGSAKDSDANVHKVCIANHIQFSKLSG